MILILIFGNTSSIGDFKTINKWQGLVLILCTISYIVYTIYEERKLKNKKIDAEIIKDVENKGEYKTKVIVIYMILRNIRLKIWLGFCC